MHSFLSEFRKKTSPLFSEIILILSEKNVQVFLTKKLWEALSNSKDETLRVPKLTKFIAESDSLESMQRLFPEIGSKRSLGRQIV